MVVPEKATVGVLALRYNQAESESEDWNQYHAIRATANGDMAQYCAASDPGSCYLQCSGSDNNYYLSYSELGSYSTMRPDVVILACVCELVPHSYANVRTRDCSCGRARDWKRVAVIRTPGQHVPGYECARDWKRVAVLTRCCSLVAALGLDIPHCFLLG
jgi:hypothetical protein